MSDDNRPGIVCMCGSTRFIDQMAVCAWQFEKGGLIALSCHLLPAWYRALRHHQAEEEGVAERLDALHLRKVELADFLYVVNVGGYIGKSTRLEIEHAERLGKRVQYLEPTNTHTSGGTCSDRSADQPGG